MFNSQFSSEGMLPENVPSNENWELNIDEFPCPLVPINARPSWSQIGNPGKHGIGAGQEPDQQC